jgi:hypothetical protein
MRPTLAMPKCSIRSRGDLERRPSLPNVFWRPFRPILNWSVASLRLFSSHTQCHASHRSACSISTLPWFIIRILQSHPHPCKLHAASTKLVSNHSPFADPHCLTNVSRWRSLSPFQNCKTRFAKQWRTKTTSKSSNVCFYSTSMLAPHPQFSVKPLIHI